MTVTRRSFLAGAGATATATATAAGGLLAVAPPTAVAADLSTTTRTVVRRGRALAVTPRGDRVVVAHDARRTIAILGPRSTSRIVEVGGQPLDVAISPDGRLAAVTTASWDAPGLALVDLRTGTLARRLAVGPAPFACAFTGDGRRLLVTGGEQQGTVHVIDVRRRAVMATRTIGLAPRGIAIGAGDGPAWITLAGERHVVGVDTRTGRILRTHRTADVPDRIALSPSGTRVLVTHAGVRQQEVIELDLRSGRSRRHVAGRLPAAVAWTPAGRRLVVLGADGAIVVLGAHGVARRLAVPGSPRGLAVAGRRAWTVDALTAAVKRVTV